MRRVICARYGGVMPTRIFTMTTLGLEGKVIEVETDIAAGLPSFTIVGLADTGVQEARERIRSAIKNSGYQFPMQRKVINLAPADIPKHGPAFDLPMAIGILASSKQIAWGADGAAHSGTRIAIIGELALDGSVRSVPGMIPMIQGAQRNNFDELLIPEENAWHLARTMAHAIGALKIIPIGTLRQAVLHITGAAPISPCEIGAAAPSTPPSPSRENPFRAIAGQNQAKQALVIAAAGHHNLILCGPPGVGKTLLAHTIPRLLPPLAPDQLLEVSAIYSLRGLPYERAPHPPIREIHHTTSRIALIGGTGSALPGELSLAHHGALILDEIAEFPRHLLESLRQPLENKTVTVTRTRFTVTYPARILCIGTANPCPCGYSGDSAHTCTCTNYHLQQYQKHLSGPFLDRMDLWLALERTAPETMLAEREPLTTEPPTDPLTADPHTHIARARERQTARYRDTQFITNSDLTADAIKTYCPLTVAANDILIAIARRDNLSNRAISRTIKVARTIADLDEANHTHIQPQHIARASQFRHQKAGNSS